MTKPELVVSYAPHWHCGSSIRSAMHTWALALAPAAAFGIYLYGVDGARVIALSVLCCVVCEALVQRLFKKPITVVDGSAVLAGLLLALILPASAPFWLVMVGSLMCILVGKQVFGGLGSNPFNAVLIGWAALKISWKAQMDFRVALVNYDLATAVKYPLGVLWRDGASALSDVRLFDLLVGREAGGIGCSPALLLAIGGVFLVLRGVISWRVPISFLLGVVISASIFWLADSTKYADPVFHILAGNVMIGALFLAPDYSSSPVSKWGMAFFGLGCGLLTVLLRIWSAGPDGTFFAILLMNLITPFLDMMRPRRTSSAEAA